MKPLLLLVGLMLTAGCVDQHVFIRREEAVEVFENTLGADVTSLDLGTYNGHMAVQLWDSEAYKIEVTKWARGITTDDARERVESMSVEVSVTGTMLTLVVEEVREAGADVTAYLPRKPYDIVEISSSNGYLEMEEMTASRVSLETSNGYVDASVTAETISIRTSNARIRGFFQGNMVGIDTSNEEVNIECGDGGKYTIDTSNARVAVKAGTRGEFTIATSNGSVEVTVEGDFSFDLRTSNSHIEVEAGGVTFAVDSQTHKKGSTAAAPWVIVTATTSNASITVKKWFHLPFLVTESLSDLFSGSGFRGEGCAVVRMISVLPLAFLRPIHECTHACTGYFSKQKEHWHTLAGTDGRMWRTT